MKTILDDDLDYIPSQLQQIIDRGQEGLKSYGLLLGSIEKVLKRNYNLTDQLLKYQDNIQEVQERSSLIQKGINSVREDPGESQKTMKKLEQREAEK